jgi:hypothetical protein
MGQIILFIVLSSIFPKFRVQAWSQWQDRLQSVSAKGVPQLTRQDALAMGRGNSLPEAHDTNP